MTKTEIILFREDVWIGTLLGPGHRKVRESSTLSTAVTQKADACGSRQDG